MLDPFWKHFGFSHHCQNAARIGPDHVCRLWLPSPNLVPFSQKRSGSYCTKPAQILSGWPGQVLPNHISSRNKPMCKNHLGSASFLAEYNRPTTSFRLSDSVTFFHRWSGSYCAESAMDPIWFWLCQALAKWIVWKQTGVQESTGLPLANTSKLIWMEMNYIWHV